MLDIIRFLKKENLLFLLIILPCFYSFSNNDRILINYLEGIAEVQLNNSWQNLVIGDLISSNRTIRLFQNSFLEFSIQENNYQIYEKGLYSIEKLIAQSEKLYNWKKNKSSAGYINQKRSGYSSGGVRGSDFEDNDLDFFDEKKFHLNEGISCFYLTDYNSALFHFSEAVQLSEITEDQNIYYLKALTEFYLDRPDKSLKTLNSFNWNENQNFYEKLILLNVELLINSFQLNKALQLIKTINFRKISDENIKVNLSDYQMFCEEYN